MKLLVRYLHERLIYRISVSKYRENFFLKGGSLLFAYNGMKGRPTQDIDFLAAKISRDAVRLKEIFAETFTNIKKPVVGLGVEGIKVEIYFCPLIIFSPVENAIQ